MEPILPSLAEQHAELEGLLVGLDESGWRAPTRCEGWDVADVVLHLAQTDVMAVGSATGTYESTLAKLVDGARPATGVDDGAAAMVERDRHLSPAEIFERWRAQSAHLREVLAAADPSTRVTWVAGTLSVRTLCTTRLAECWIHTGDVAGAIGADLVPGARLGHVARLAWRTLPYAFAQAGKELRGPVAMRLAGPTGEEWAFDPEGEPVTWVTGSGVELCNVAARRVLPAATSLTAEGPDGEDVLALVRTYA